MRNWLNFGIVFIIALLTACSQPSDETQTIIQPTDIPVLPATAQSNTYSPTEAISPTPTLAPPASLTTAELHQYLDPFTSFDDTCALPCYNGVTVGEAGLGDVLNFYARLGIGISDMTPGDYDAIKDGEGHLRAFLNKTSDQVQVESQGIRPSLVDVGFANHEVQYVYVGWQYLPDYLSVSRIIGALGEPEGIEIGLIVDSDTPPAYALHLFFPEAQIGFAFYGNLTLDGSHYNLCLTDDVVEAVFMGVFASDIPALEGLPNSESLLPADDVPDLSSSVFIETLTNNQCLSFTLEQAQTWQGN